MLNWLSWIIALLRGWLGIRAEIQQKRDEHAGVLEQQNADLQAQARLSPQTPTRLRSRLTRTRRRRKPTS
jgi:hypothetical protein